jgi:hypothetical protein
LAREKEEIIVKHSNVIQPGLLEKNVKKLEESVDVKKLEESVDVKKLEEPEDFKKLEEPAEVKIEKPLLVKR